MKYVKIQIKSGDKFQNLTAIKEDGKIGHKTAWIFKCDCGKEIRRIASKVANGMLKTCGCWLKGPRGPKITTPTDFQFIVGTCFYWFRSGARRRNLSWNLTRKDVALLIGADCHYCGNHPYPRNAHVKGRPLINANGIDRMNNKRGYELDNCVPCCDKCNQAKMDMDYEEFRALIFNIAKHLGYLNVSFTPEGLEKGGEIARLIRYGNLPMKNPSWGKPIAMLPRA